MSEYNNFNDSYQSNFTDSTKEDKMNVSSDYVSKSQQAGKYLGQILHSYQCQGHCGNSQCLSLVQLINHCMFCHENESTTCQITGCVTTKKLMNHRERCITVEKDCLLCQIATKQFNSMNTFLCRTPTSITSLHSPSLRTQRKSLDSDNSITSQRNRSNTEIFYETNNSIKKDGDFVVPTMMPKRFRCLSTNDANNNNINS